MLTPVLYWATFSFWITASASLCSGGMPSDDPSSWFSMVEFDSTELRRARFSGALLDPFTWVVFVSKIRHQSGDDDDDEAASILFSSFSRASPHLQRLQHLQHLHQPVGQQRAPWPCGVGRLAAYLEEIYYGRLAADEDCDATDSNLLLSGNREIRQTGKESVCIVVGNVDLLGVGGGSRDLTFVVSKGMKG